MAPGANGPTVQNTVMEVAVVELAIVLMVLAAKEIALKMNLVTPILVLHAVAGKNGVNAQNRAMAAKGRFYNNFTNALSEGIFSRFSKFLEYILQQNSSFL